MADDPGSLIRELGIFPVWKGKENKTVEKQTKEIYAHAFDY